MAYSTELESLIEDIIFRDEEVTGELTSKKMFGGVGYLVNGNMCFGIYKEYLVLRTTQEHASGLLQEEGFIPFDITGTPMKGWIMAGSMIYENRSRLKILLKSGIDFALGLPPKEKK